MTPREPLPRGRHFATSGRNQPAAAQRAGAPPPPPPGNGDPPGDDDEDGNGGEGDDGPPLPIHIDQHQCRWCKAWFPWTTRSKWASHNLTCPDRPSNSATDDSTLTGSALDRASASPVEPDSRQSTVTLVSEDQSRNCPERGDLPSHSEDEHSPLAQSAQSGRLESPPIVTGSSFQHDEGTLSSAAYDERVRSAVKAEQPPESPEAGAEPRLDGNEPSGREQPPDLARRTPVRGTNTANRCRATARQNAGDTLG